MFTDVALEGEDPDEGLGAGGGHGGILGRGDRAGVTAMAPLDVAQVTTTGVGVGEHPVPPYS